MVNKLHHTNWQLEKPSVSNLHFSYYPYAVQNSTAHVATKGLNIRNQPQKKYRGIFVGIPQHPHGYLIYEPSTQKIVSSHDIVFDKIFSHSLAYTIRTYSEALAMQIEVLYIPWATVSHEKTSVIIPLA